MYRYDPTGFADRVAQIDREYRTTVERRLAEALPLLGRPDDWAGMAARCEIGWVRSFVDRYRQDLVYIDPVAGLLTALICIEPSYRDGGVLWYVSDPWPNGRPSDPTSLA